MYISKNKFLIFTVLGLVILANPLNVIATGGYRLIPIILMIAAVILLIIGKIITRQIKQHLFISVEMFLFNFSSLVIVPMLMVIAFSFTPLQMKYGVLELWYVIVNGFFFWLGIYTFVAFFNQDKRKVLEIVAYLSLLLIGLSEVLIKDNQNLASGNQSDNSPDSSTPQDPGYIGVWRIIGVLIMISFRFIFWVFKVLKAWSGSDSIGYNEYFSTNFID